MNMYIIFVAFKYQICVADGDDGDLLEEILCTYNIRWKNSYIFNIIEFSTSNITY